MAGRRQDGRREEADFMDAPFARTLAAAVAWNWFCTVYGRGTFAHVTFTLTSIYALGIPLALFGFVFDCCKRNKGARSKAFLGALWRVVFLIFIQVIHLECGQYLLDKDVANAKTYCESFITGLEEYKEERGVYPPRLSLPVDDDREKPDQRPKEVPWMLQDSVQAKDQNQASRTAQFYKAADDGRSFRFFFDDPSAIGGVQYVFNSSTSDWTLETNHPRP